MKANKPVLTLVTPENIHTFKANPQSKHGVAKGDEDYEKTKEAFRQLFAKRLEIDPNKIR